MEEKGKGRNKGWRRGRVRKGVMGRGAAAAGGCKHKVGEYKKKLITVFLVETHGTPGR